MNHHAQESLTVTLTKSQWRDIERLAGAGYEWLEHQVKRGAFENDGEAKTYVENLVESDAAYELTGQLVDHLSPMRVCLSGVVLNNDARERVNITLDLPAIMFGEELKQHLDGRIIEATGFRHLGEYLVEEVR